MAARGGASIRACARRTLWHLAPLTVAAACAAQEKTATEVTLPPQPAAAAATPTASATTTASAAPVASSAVQAPSASCPPTFAAAYVASCHVGDAPCSYPEGTCQCGDYPHCGGARMPPARPGQPGKEYCNATDPKWLRPDGCTDGTPKDGAPCAKDGQVCSYGPCSWSAIKASCKGGVWHLSQYHGPPPP